MHKVDLPTLTIFIFSLRPLTANLIVFEEKSFGEAKQQKGTFISLWWNLGCILLCLAQVTTMQFHSNYSA